MVRFITALNLVDKEDVEYIKSRKTRISDINHFKINIDASRLFKVNGFKVFNLTNGIIENLSLEDAISEDSGIQWNYRFNAEGYVELNCFGDLKSGIGYKNKLMFSYGYEILDIYPRYIYLRNYDEYSLANLPIGIKIYFDSEEFYLSIGMAKVYSWGDLEDNEPIVFVHRNYKLNIETDFENFYRPVGKNSHCIGDVFVVIGSGMDDVCIIPSDCTKCVVGSSLTKGSISIVLHPNVKLLDIYNLDDSCRLNLFISSKTAEQVVNMITRKVAFRLTRKLGFKPAKDLADKLCGNWLDAIGYLRDYNIHIELY